MLCSRAANKTGRRRKPRSGRGKKNKGDPNKKSKTSNANGRVRKYKKGKSSGPSGVAPSPPNSGSQKTAEGMQQETKTAAAAIQENIPVEPAVLDTRETKTMPDVNVEEEIYVNEDAEKTVSAPAVEIVDETEN